MSEFKFEIVEHLLTLSESDKGWTKELNRVSFNGAEPNLIFVHGAQTTAKWVKVSHLQTTNSKSSWMLFADKKGSTNHFLWSVGFFCG